MLQSTCDNDSVLNEPTCYTVVHALGIQHLALIRPPGQGSGDTGESAWEEQFQMLWKVHLFNSQQGKKL